MLTTAVEPVTIVGSPMESGRRAGRAPNTPASYTSSRSGATVRWARLTAMFGRPTPTKQTRCPSSARAAATIIISDLLNAEVVTCAPRDHIQARAFPQYRTRACHAPAVAGGGA